jgi:hypothetical protein
LLITKFGYVGDDRFEEIKCKNRCDNFSFGLPNSVLTESHAISQKSFHVGNINFLFGENENFLDRHEFSHHVWVDKIDSDLIHDVKNGKIICLSYILFNVVAVFICLETLEEPLNERNLEWLEWEYEDFVTEALYGIDIVVV